MSPKLHSSNFDTEPQETKTVVSGRMVFEP